jgi:hypothetical protein
MFELFRSVDAGCRRRYRSAANLAVRRDGHRLWIMGAWSFAVFTQYYQQKWMADRWFKLFRIGRAGPPESPHAAGIR